MNKDKEAIERLRKDLPTIRNIVGWSSEHLAALLDISKTTAIKLENVGMSMVQYLAIRSLLQEEIDTNGNKTLESAIEILVDRDDIPEQIRQELRNHVAATAKTVGRKAGAAAVSKAVSESIEPVIEKIKSERGIQEMSQKEEQARKVANDILGFVNAFGCDEKTFAESICTSHRTLQQSVMRLFMATIRRMAENDTDERNENAVALAKKITEIAGDYPLPLI